MLFTKILTMHYKVKYKLAHIKSKRFPVQSFKLSPAESTISLSIPRGPRVVRTASTIAWQAFILLTSCGLPWEVSVPSFSKMIGACCTQRITNTASISTLPFTTCKKTNSHNKMHVKNENAISAIHIVDCVKTHQHYISRVMSSGLWLELATYQHLHPY